MGIEPTQSAWKAEILPLNYTRTLRLYHAFLCQQHKPTLSIIAGLAHEVNTFLKKYYFL